MKASALLILLLFPSLALAQQQYFGRTATSVKLPSPADPADFAKLTIHDNDIITEENIRSSIQALYGTGHYQKIAADVTEMGPDMVVTFIVTAQYYFSTFRLEPDDLLPRPITSYFQPPLGKKYSGTVVDRLKADTKSLFADNGYFDVEIDEHTDFDDSTHLTTVVLNAKVPRERAKIHSILFTGDQKIFPVNELQRELKISKDDDFDTDKIDKATIRIRKKFVDKGYLTAKVSIDNAYVEDINGVNLTVSIDPGKTTKIEVVEDKDSKSLISDAELRTLVPFYAEGTVDPELKEEGNANIRAYYRQKGYFEADVSYRTVEAVDQSETIEYTVVKGQKHRVRAIRIVGNSFFTESEILRSMKNRQGKLDSGIFSDELLKSDVSAITALYQDAGFRHTTVSPDTNETTNHEIEIIITIHERFRSVLGNIVFTGNLTFTEPQLWNESGIQSDQIYSAAKISNARGALGAFYFKNGFPEVRIESNIDTDPDYDVINVTFDIVEGPRYKVGLILVAGNVRTEETIVTRAIDIHPGDPYNPQLILESQQKLYGLGIFDRVDIVPIDQDAGSNKNLLIQIEESKTILVTPGVGVTTLLGTREGNPSIGVNNPITGTTPGPRATLEVSKINLRGLNQTLALRLRAGYRQAQFQASYRNPRVFRLHDHDYLGVVAVSFDKTHYPSYDSSDVNISLQLIRKLNKSDTLLISPNYDTVNLQNIRVNPNLSRFPTEKGVIQIGRLDTTFIRDRRTNPKKPSYAAVDPSSGIFSTSDFQVANKALGSEVDFIALYNQTNYYFPVQVNKVLATSARVGWKHPYGGDLLLPISERFFAGGSSTLRGFSLDDAGPPGGGQVLLIGNLEYRFPLKKLPTHNFNGALFYDTGNVFETPADVSLRKFSHTIGFGLRYMTPLGPIRVDVGNNLMPRPQDKKYHVFFSLGYPF